ncbi:hypothetical protein VNO78_15100 [Psophocarpus tetragonolobus]|uniref:F-box domain-containing protein n=1 Tax=Psophocarpus tetragonolobus TaxID=3891 RepID=A0AAN9SDI8_PSOTE
MSWTNSKEAKCCSSNGMEELSQDPLFEILNRLPFSSLLQCKCINKQFQLVISDPRYLHCRLTHTQLSPPFQTNTLFLLFNFHLPSDYHHKTHFSINSNNRTHILKGSNFLPPSWSQDQDQDQDRDGVRVKASYHDLLLCSTQTDDYVHYFVCNPFTKHCVPLPPLSKSCTHELSRVGFMCDQSRSRFRVVHIPIICFEWVRSFKVNMYSSETGKWGASIVPFSGHSEVLMSNSCFRNILVCDQKFVWWINNDFLVCDPFVGTNSSWRVMNMYIPCKYSSDNKVECDIYNGTCNGRVKILEFSRQSSVCRVNELVHLEQGEWSSCHYFLDRQIGREININNMNLLAFHPHCEHIIYLYSNKGIFLCDYKNHKLESLYTALDEDFRIWGNLMSLVFPQCPTPLSIFNASKV